MARKKSSDSEKSAVHSHEKKAAVAKPEAKKGAALFIEIKPENYFVLCDGQVVKDYLELARLLETLNDDMFYYHVNDQKNDFANWINDVFKEEDLAKDLRAARGRMETMALLYKHLFEKLAKER